MISLSRPFFTPVAILLRQQSGGFVVGFLPFAQTMLWLAGMTLALLVLRGFFGGTWIGSVLDVPIARPMTAVTLLIAAMWLVRSIGLWSPQGPMRDHEARHQFTGRPAAFWSRAGVTNREWTVLEVYEPLLLCIAGVGLLVLPSTRIAGVLFLLMAAACTYQTVRDVYCNEHGEGESLDDFVAGVLRSNAEDEEDDVDEDDPQLPASPFADLPDDMLDLLDDDARAAAERQRAAAKTSTPRPKTPNKTKRRSRVYMTPRGPGSYVPGAVLASLFYVILGFGLFVVVVAPSEMYEKSPDRWRAAIVSVQTGAARIWLARPAGREDPGELATAVLDRVAPDDLRRLRQDAVRQERARILDLLAKTTEAVATLRETTEASLGFPLSIESTTPQFDELLLEHESVAEAWVALLNGAEGYSSKVAEARVRLDSVDKPDGVDIEAYDALYAEAEPWSGEVSGLVVHIEHLAKMIEAKRFEDALDRDRDNEP